jgi:hypothetical protein
MIKTITLSNVPGQVGHTLNTTAAQFAAHLDCHHFRLQVAAGFGLRTE